MNVDDLHVEGVSDPVLIGQGGYGNVYRCQEIDLDRPVAVKILSGQLDEVGQNRFERERRAMGVLSGHPNIVMVHRSGLTEAGRPYLVMEFLAGGSIADRLGRSGPLPWPTVLEVGIEVCGALETAHRAGVLHRDIKPANLLESNLGVVKLGDFGIARMQGAPETRSAMITASIAHAAPEIIEGKRPDVLADVYSLGSTLFELLTGSPAYVRDTDESLVAIIARVAQDPVPDLRSMGVPDLACRALESAMAKDPLARPSSAEAFGRSLQAVQRSLGLTETPMRIEGERTVDLVGQPSPPTSQPITSGLPPPPSPSPKNPVAGPAPSVSGPMVPQGPNPTSAGYHQIPTATPSPPQAATRPPAQPPMPRPDPRQPAYAQMTGARATPAPSPPGLVALAPARAAAPKQSKVWMWVTLAMLGFFALVTLVLIALANGPDRIEVGRATATTDPSTSRSSASTGTASPGSRTTVAAGRTTPTTELPETAVPTTAETSEADPPPTVVSDIVFAGDYDAYVEISGDESPIRFEAPAEWADVMVTKDQISVSTDLNGLLSRYESSGVTVHSTVLPFAASPDLTLDGLTLEGCIRRDDRMDVALAGMTGRSVRVSGCGPSGQTEVTYLAVVPDDGTVLIVIALQATDPRDAAAFAHVLDTFRVSTG